MQVFENLYIDGAWVSPAGSGSFAVVDSSDEAVFASVPRGNPDDVDRAVAAARTAFVPWAATAPAERARLLRTLADGITARRDELATAICREVGMPLHLCGEAQVDGPVVFLKDAAAVIEHGLPEERLGNSLVLKEPAGVVGAITPWNYPLHQLVAKVAPALAAGCTVVAKPSEVAPVSAFVFAGIAAAAGVPAGVFNLVTGAGPEAGEALAAHPDVDLISFTGSTRAGRRVAELAARTVKRVRLELGGKSANLILDDADLETAVRSGVGKCFGNAGQNCSALTRMLVPRARLAEAEALARDEAESYAPGDPFAPGTRLGPLASRAQLDAVRRFIRRGIDEGAELLTGGPEPPDGFARGYFVRPTVFTRVESSMAIAQQEIFGPVLAIIPHGGDEDAVRLANDSIYGLSAGVWSGDPERAWAVALRLRTGQVAINGGAFNLHAPFGGYKQSGYGRELGPHSVGEYFELKALQL